MSKKILISPSSFGTCGSQPLDQLKTAGYQALLNTFKRRLTADEVLELGAGCIGIIAGVEPLNETVIEGLPQLQCISRCGVGMDNIDLEKAHEHGVVVCNTPYGPTRAVAELTVGLIFDVLRGISRRDRKIRQGQWDKKMGFLLQGKQVGIIGLGRIGRLVGELLLCLGACVYGYDINPDTSWLKKHKVPLIPMEQLLRESDIICVHTFYTKGSEYLLGKKQLSMMKKEAILINMSRGGVVDEQALFQRLQSNKLSGAALDVFEQEPYNGPLTTLDSVVITPHIGSYAREARLQMELQAVQNLVHTLEKKSSENKR